MSEFVSIAVERDRRDQRACAEAGENADEPTRHGDPANEEAGQQE